MKTLWKGETKAGANARQHSVHRDHVHAIPRTLTHLAAQQMAPARPGHVEPPLAAIIEHQMARPRSAIVAIA